MTTSSVDAVKGVLKVETVGPDSIDKSKLTTNARDNQSERTMLAAVWNGKKTVDVVQTPVPTITDPVRACRAAPAALRGARRLPGRAAGSACISCSIQRLHLMA